MTEQEAQIFAQRQGLTDLEFRDLPNYGKIEHYPLCSSQFPEQKLGNYQVSAKCLGRPKNSNRLLGRLIYENSETWHLVPYL